MLFLFIAYLAHEVRPFDHHDRHLAIVADGAENLVLRGCHCLRGSPPPHSALLPPEGCPAECSRQPERLLGQTHETRQASECLIHGRCLYAGCSLQQMSPTNVKEFQEK